MQHAWKIKNIRCVFLGKPEGKIPLRRPRLRWGDNIMINVYEHGKETLGSV
jgi:hypothetical protein